MTISVVKSLGEFLPYYWAIIENYCNSLLFLQSSMNEFVGQRNKENTPW